MDFILVILYNSILFRDQYEEENIFRKSKWKKGMFGNLEVTLPVDHKKTKDVETLKTALCPKP